MMSSFALSGVSVASPGLQPSSEATDSTSIQKHVTSGSLRLRLACPDASAVLSSVVERALGTICKALPSLLYDQTWT